MKVGIFLLAIAALCLYPIGNYADSTAPPAVFEKIWSANTLYESEDNPYIQNFSLVGRYHGQYWSAESKQQRESDWENRRVIFGFNTRFLHQFTLEAQIGISEDFEPFYDDFYDAFIKWENHDDSFAISAGRLDFVYAGMERTTSSKRIYTIERALLVNQIMPGEVVGTYLNGTQSRTSWQFGMFAGDINEELSSFDAGYAALAGLSHQLSLLSDQGTVHLDYVYNDGDEGNNAFEPYEHIISVWYVDQSDRFSIGIDATGATGLENESDVFGFTFLPTWDLAENVFIGGDQFELALRYHYANSSDEAGLPFSARYEQEVASGAGDNYNSFYAGLNYLIYGDKLKLMAGLEYFDMSGVKDPDAPGPAKVERNVHGWSFVTGLRLYF